MKEIPFSQLKLELGPISCFIGCLSYEKRCVSAIKNLNTSTIGEINFFYNMEFENEVENYKGELPSSANYVELKLQDPIATTDALLSVLSKCPNSGTVVVDITTFTRESLLILLRILSALKKKIPPVTLLYTPARTMSDSWLSRGVSQCRSIVGFSGDLAPHKSLHLVVMTGFEIERARHIIEVYEPAKISIGIGDAKESINSALYERNRRFVDQLSNYYSGAVERFSFSLRDPYRAKESLTEHLNKFEGFNTSIAPMNNKVSTIAAGLYALENKNVQLCYAEPVEYNTEGYSESADYCFIMPLLLSDVDDG